MITGAPWTFSGVANILVLDLFSAGDMFQLFDNGVSLGSTTTVPNTGADLCVNDIACALSNSGYSRGIFSVGAGSHSLTIQHIRDLPVMSSGAAVFSVTAVTSSVPEPATSVLLGASLVGLTFLRRRRRRA
jgi:hypothetical protein